MLTICNLYWQFCYLWCSMYNRRSVMGFYLILNSTMTEYCSEVFTTFFPPLIIKEAKGFRRASDWAVEGPPTEQYCFTSFCLIEYRTAGSPINWFFAPSREVSTKTSYCRIGKLCWNSAIPLRAAILLMWFTMKWNWVQHPWFKLVGDFSLLLSYLSFKTN